MQNACIASVCFPFSSCRISLQPNAIVTKMINLVTASKVFEIFHSVLFTVYPIRTQFVHSHIVIEQIYLKLYSKKKKKKWENIYHFSWKICSLNGLWLVSSQYHQLSAVKKRSTRTKWNFIVKHFYISLKCHSFVISWQTKWNVIAMSRRNYELT